jgi:hypothetical protein
MPSDQPLFSTPAQPRGQIFTDAMLEDAFSGDGDVAAKKKDGSWSSTSSLFGGAGVQ